MEDFFKSKNIINILWRWKIHLGVLIIAALLLSAFFSSSLFITPLFKSFAIVYPSNVNPYSDESETEQMMQIFQSKDIRDSLIQKFDLVRHYGLDPNDKYLLSTLLWEYGKKIKINKTPYSAVTIEVLDKDPKQACDMVNEIMHQYNLKIHYLHKEKFYEVVQNLRTIVDVKKKELDSITEVENELGTKYGLLDYPNQTREVMRAYLSGGGSGRASSSEVKRLKKNMEEKGGNKERITLLMISETRDYATMKLDYDRAVLDYNKNFTYVNVLNKPFVSDKKSYPIRWVIVVLSTLAVTVVGIIVISILERRKSSLSKSETHS